MGLIYDLAQAESIIDTGSIYCTVGRAKARTASGLGEVGRLGALALASVMTRQAILGGGEGSQAVCFRRATRHRAACDAFASSKWRTAPSNLSRQPGLQKPTTWPSYSVGESACTGLPDQGQVSLMQSAMSRVRVVPSFVATLP